MRLALMVAAALACGSGTAHGKTSCLTDAAIDKAVGDQVRSGAPFVDTSGLPEAPLCSGLTMAQQIQRIRAAAFPDEQRRLAEEHAALVAREEEATRARQAPIPVVVPPATIANIAEDQSATRPARITASRKSRARPMPARHKARQSYFSSCREARAAGAAPMRRGDPGYAPRLDRDGDGIACE